MNNISRRQFVAGSGLAAASLALAACGGSSTSASTEAASSAAAASDTTLIVFAAASMTESLDKVNEQYKSETGVTVQPNYDSSGTLKTQIQEGAVCDVFISAGQKQMNQLDITADKEVNTEGLDFVVDGTRFNILENEVTLVVPEGNPAGIQNFDDLAAKLKEGSVKLCMGNSDVPVGQYTQKILAYYELSEEDLAGSGAITYGSNVKEVTTQVSEAAVDCGVIYKTDATSAGLTIVDSATKDMCGQVIYPAAAIKSTTDEEAAKAYLEYLKGDYAKSCFEEVGFTPIAE